MRLSETRAIIKKKRVIKRVIFISCKTFRSTFIATWVVIIVRTSQKSKSAKWEKHTCTLMGKTQLSASENKAKCKSVNGKDMFEEALK